MKKIAKAVLAVLLAAAMVLSLSACYNENLTWAAEYNGERLPVGSYIYYLSSAYSSLASDLSGDERVLSAEKDGQKAEDWIRAEGKKDMLRYFFVKSELARLGLPNDMSDDPSSTSLTNTYWSLLENSMTEYGVSKDSFDIAFSQYSALRVRLFEALYGEGGEKEIPEEDLRSYYTENYYGYEYFSDSTYAYDDENQYTEKPEEEVTEMKEALEACAEEVRGGASLAEVSAKYAEERELEDSYVTDVGTEDDLRGAYLPSDLIVAIREMAEDEVRVVELSSNIVVVHKLPAAQTVEDSLADDTVRTNILFELGEEDFDAYLDAGAENLTGVTLNEAAMRRCDLNRFAKTTPNGTKPDPTEAPESEAE